MCSPSTVLAHRYAESSHDAEFSYRLKQIYSVDVVDECRNTSRLYQTLALEAKGHMHNAVFVDIFLEWSDSKNVCDINTKQTKKSHRPHHCQEIATIIHHHPPSSLWSSSLQTLLFTYIYRWMQRKIHVCDVNAKCTNTNGFHNCTARMDYYWNFQFFKVQRIGWSLHKNILLFLAQLQF